MAASTPSTIILKAQEKVTYNEAQAGGTITPGHLVALTSTGTVVVHPTAGGSQPEKAFAVEDDARGKGITDNYDSTTNKNTRYGICSAGVEVYAILTTSQTVAINDGLESNGDGTLRKFVAQGSVAATSPAVGVRFGQIVARALEAVTTTASTSRIKVRVV